MCTAIFQHKTQRAHTCSSIQPMCMWNSSMKLVCINGFRAPDSDNADVCNTVHTGKAALIQPGLIRPGPAQSRKEQALAFSHLFVHQANTALASQRRQQVQRPPPVGGSSQPAQHQQCHALTPQAQCPPRNWRRAGQWHRAHHRGHPAATRGGGGGRHPTEEGEGGDRGGAEKPPPAARGVETPHPTPPSRARLPSHPFTTILA